MNVYVCVCVFGLVDEEGVSKNHILLKRLEKPKLANLGGKKQGKDHMSFRNMYVIS